MATRRIPFRRKATQAEGNLTAGHHPEGISHTEVRARSLGEVIPDAVPRRARSLVGERPDVRIHTSMHEFRPEDLSWVNGMRVTNPTRSIADYARAGGRPDQVEKTIAEVRARGLIRAGTGSPKG